MTIVDTLKLDDLEAGPDLDLIARNIVAAKKRLKKSTPAAVDFATAVTGLSISDTMIGSSTLTVTISDDDFVLMDSGFFDSDRDGRIDPIELVYPENSKLWWRLTQCNPKSYEQIEMVFMERAAVHMMAHVGPLKVSRAKRTRAQFLKMLTDAVKVAPITFQSHDLRVKQPIGSKADRKKDGERKTQKGPGITADPSLKIKGVTATDGQLNEVERALDVGDSLQAPELAVLAMVCAGIGESSFRAVPNAGGSNYWGVFQGSKDVFAKADTEGMASSFLNGGKGFQGGGAISIANAHRDYGPGLIAVTVEGSRSNFGSDAEAENFYGTYKDEAQALIEAYGGGFAGTTYRKQYNFEVGTTDKPHENFWDAANRLAAEVKWPFFLDGQNAYFDPDTTLIKQKPVAVITRDDPSVIRWDCDWDSRHIATELRIDLICDPFEFRAGEVFKMVGFGPGSTGSTAKLPGRWLIGQIDRERSSLFSSFTLRQPTRPEPEPLGERGSRQDTSSDTDLKNVCDQISRDNRQYVYGGGHGPKLSDIKDTDGLDCSSSCSLALYRAKMFDGTVAITSGVFATSWGEAGRGDTFTVWASTEHVFIQSEGGTATPDGEWRFDTSGGPPSGPHVRNSHRSTAGFKPRHWPSDQAGDPSVPVAFGGSSVAP